jgi:hypothetical protein
MRYLSLTLILLWTALGAVGQSSPHGKEFRIDCSQCHTSENWLVKPTQVKFDHNSGWWASTGLLTAKIVIRR